MTSFGPSINSRLRMTSFGPSINLRLRMTSFGPSINSRLRIIPLINEDEHHAGYLF